MMILFKFHLGIFLALFLTQSISFEIPVQLKNKDGTDFTTTFYFSSDEDINFKVKSFCERFIISDNFCILLYKRASNMVHEESSTVATEQKNRNSISVSIDVSSPFGVNTAVFTIASENDPMSKLSVFCIENRLDFRSCNSFKTDILAKQYQTTFNKSIDSCEIHRYQSMYNASYRFEQVFSNIYDTCYWENYLIDPTATTSDVHSMEKLGYCSGIGSRLDITAQLRNYLYSLIQRYNIRTFLDAPCGAMAWMPTLLLQIENESSVFPGFQYAGIDVVTSVVDSVKLEYKNKRNWHFYAFDITSATAWETHNNMKLLSQNSITNTTAIYNNTNSDMNVVVGSSDLIMAKDIFFHLTFDYIKRTLNNFKNTNSTYLLATSHKIVPKNRRNNNSITRSHNNNHKSAAAVAVMTNTELEGGEMFGNIIRYRVIDLTLEPFLLPPPIEEFHGDYIDATMGLWLLKDVPDYTLDSHNLPLNCHH